MVLPSRRHQPLARIKAAAEGKPGQPGRRSPGRGGEGEREGEGEGERPSRSTDPSFRHAPFAARDVHLTNGCGLCRGAHPALGSPPSLPPPELLPQVPPCRGTTRNALRGDAAAPGAASDASTGPAGLRRPSAEGRGGSPGRPPPPTCSVPGRCSG